MSERIKFEAGNIPFRQTDIVVGQSSNSTVYCYNQSNLVVKIEKPRSKRTYKSVEDALTSARDLLCTEATIADQLKKEGIDSRSFPLSTPVIHKRQDGQIIISRVQKLIPESEPLADSGLSILNFPQESLYTLKGLISASLSFWGEEKKLLELVGSSRNPQSFSKKVFRYMFPLFSSENIITDKENRIYFIDAQRFIDPPISKPQKWLGKFVYAAGTKVSQIMIAQELKRRKLQDKLNQYLN